MTDRLPGAEWANDLETGSRALARLCDMPAFKRMNILDSLAGRPDMDRTLSLLENAARADANRYPGAVLASTMGNVVRKGMLADILSPERRRRVLRVLEGQG